MDKYEIERKLSELDNKFRLELAREKIELIRQAYKSNSEQCDKVKEEISHNIRRSVQEELLNFKKENYFLQRQVHLLQQHVEHLKWEVKKMERKSVFDIELLKSQLKEFGVRFKVIEESAENVVNPRTVSRFG